MRGLPVTLLASIAGLLMAGPSLAVVSGTAVGVNPSATDVVNKSTRTLVVGADVSQGDKIVTGPAGQVQLVFGDDTHLVVGPGSSLVIESYLLKSDKTAGNFAVSALGGTFRFITGKSDHSAYTINTPTGTIGVRGTAFDFMVNNEAAAPRPSPGSEFLGGTTVALFRGSVLLCNLDKQCVTLTHKCEVGTITDPKTFKIGPVQTIEEGLRQRFRYISSQKPLLHDFWVDESRLCFIDTFQTNSLATFNTTTPSPLPPQAPPPPCDSCCDSDCYRP